jgi:alpha-N-arabinofuranosidase
MRGATGEVLTAPEIDSVNTFEATDAVAPKPISLTVSGGSVQMTLPSKSVTMIGIDE